MSQSRYTKNLEIERTFLVHNNSWTNHKIKVQKIRQVYLKVAGNEEVRLRLDDENKQAWLTIKRGDKTKGQREEIEIELGYTVTLPMVLMAIDHGCPYVQKTRYTCRYKEKDWEIDILNLEAGTLYITEVELSSTDEQFEKPPWAGQEITNDKRYANKELAKCQKK